MTRTVVVQRGPEVQLLGDAVLLQGAAVLDVYRVLAEGITAVRRRDCIEPSDRLLSTLAALKAASSASLAISDVQRGPTARKSVKSGEVVGVMEAGHMLGVGSRHVTRLAPSLGGWRGNGRGRPWQFDTGLIRAYLDVQGEAA